MHSLKKGLLALTLVLLGWGCEKEENGYAPQIGTLTELKGEIDRQVKSASTANTILDSTMQLTVFETYTQILAQASNNLAFLQAHVNATKAKQTDEGQIAVYTNLKAQVDASYLKWKTLSDAYNEFKQKGIVDVFFAFNGMKMFLFQPEYVNGDALNLFRENYSKLQKYNGLSNLSFFKQRTDFDYVTQAGASLDDLVKISDYIIAVLPTYHSQTFTDKYEINHFKIKQQLSLILSIVNGETLFNQYLKKIFEAKQNATYNYSLLVNFGVRIDHLYQLKKSFEGFADKRLIFMSSLASLPALYAEVATAYSNAKSIADGLQLVKTYFGKVYPNATELLYFGQNIKALTDYKLDFLSFSARLNPLFQKYKSADSIDSSTDITEIKQLADIRNSLVNKYLANETDYRYFLESVFNELSDDTSEQALGWMLISLQSKLKL